MQLWMLKALGGLLIAGALAYVGKQVHDGIYDRGYAAGIAELHRYQGEVAAERAEFERQAREREERHRAELAIVAEQFEQWRRNAHDDAERVIADERAGKRRLRDEWAACETRARVSEATAAPSQLDAAAELRRASRGRILRIVGECEAHVRGLQRVIEAGQ